MTTRSRSTTSVGATVGRVATCLALLLALAPSAGAATFTVNSTDDTTDGVCGAAAGACTLREAVEAAVATAGRDTIKFAPAVFTGATNPVGIVLGTPLPVIADPAGTAIDGTGAHVLVTGGATVEQGFVFASAPGVPLLKPLVANVWMASFTGTAVHICGGVPPMCDGDVSGATVRHVIANGTGGDGIRIEARINSKSRVSDSAAFHGDGVGIRIFATESLTGAKVERSTVRDYAEGGIGVIGGSAADSTGVTIIDSVAVENGSGGVSVVGRNVAKPKLTNVVAYANDDLGVAVRARNGGTLSGAALANVVAVLHGQEGISLDGSAAVAGVSLKRAFGNANLNGLFVFSPGTVSGVKVAESSGVGNATDGLIITTDELVTGAKVAGGFFVGNGRHGVAINGDGNSVQKVHASANTVDGVHTSLGSGSLVTKSVAEANGTNGIRLDAGATSATVQKNVALGNGVDLSDGHPDCDANTWANNVFRTANQICIP